MGTAFLLRVVADRYRPAADGGADCYAPRTARNSLQIASPATAAQ